MGDGSDGTRDHREKPDADDSGPVPEPVSDETPTSPVAGSIERAAAFETARRDSATPDDEAEYRDVHRRRTVRRRVR
jgi:hypothetical protein